MVFTNNKTKWRILFYVRYSDFCSHRTLKDRHETTLFLSQNQYFIRIFKKKSPAALSGVPSGIKTNLFGFAVWPKTITVKWRRATNKESTCYEKHPEPGKIKNLPFGSGREVDKKDMYLCIWKIVKSPHKIEHPLVTYLLGAQILF